MIIITLHFRHTSEMRTQTLIVAKILQCFYLY